MIVLRFLAATALLVVMGTIGLFFATLPYALAILFAVFILRAFT